MELMAEPAGRGSGSERWQASQGAQRERPHRPQTDGACAARTAKLAPAACRAGVARLPERHGAAAARQRGLTVRQALHKGRPRQVAAPHDAHQHQQVGGQAKHQGGDECAQHLRVVVLHSKTAFRNMRAQQPLMQAVRGQLETGMRGLARRPATHRVAPARPTHRKHEDGARVGKELALLHGKPRLEDDGRQQRVEEGAGAAAGTGQRRSDTGRGTAAASPQQAGSALEAPAEHTAGLCATLRLHNPHPS